MPLNEIPKYFDRDTRRLVDAALEDAWQELKKDGLADTALTRRKLASTIVALASVGETTLPSSNGLQYMLPEGRYRQKPRRHGKHKKRFRRLKRRLKPRGPD